MCPNTGTGTDGDVKPVKTGRLGEGCQKTTAQGERQGSFNPVPDDLVWGVHTEKMYWIEETQETKFSGRLDGGARRHPPGSKHTLDARIRVRRSKNRSPGTWAVRVVRDALGEAVRHDVSRPHRQIPRWNARGNGARGRNRSGWRYISRMRLGSER